MGMGVRGCSLLRTAAVVWPDTWLAGTGDNIFSDISAARFLIQLLILELSQPPCISRWLLHIWTSSLTESSSRLSRLLRALTARSRSSRCCSFSLVFSRHFFAASRLLPRALDELLPATVAAVAPLPWWSSSVDAGLLPPLMLLSRPTLLLRPRGWDMEPWRDFLGDSGQTESSCDDADEALAVFVDADTVESDAGDDTDIGGRRCRRPGVPGCGDRIKADGLSMKAIGVTGESCEWSPTPAEEYWKPAISADAPPLPTGILGPPLETPLLAGSRANSGTR